jgi:hypothetical protein
MPDVNDILTDAGDLVVTGDIVVKDANGNVRIRLDHETGGIFIHNGDGDIVFHLEMPGNNLRFGGHNRDGDLLLYSKSASNLLEDEATFHLDSEHGEVRLGGNRTAGKLVCLAKDGKQTAFLNGANGDMTLGGNGRDGDVKLRGTGSSTRVHLRVGGDADPDARVDINGAKGEIKLSRILFADGTALVSGSQSGLVTQSDLVDHERKANELIRAVTDKLSDIASNVADLKSAIFSIESRLPPA